MTRLSSVSTCLACLLIGAIAGSEIAAWPSGLAAPELSEPEAVPFVNGRPVYRAKPITPIWTAVLPHGDWNGCDGPCGEHPGVIDDEAPAVPLPSAVWAMLAALGAIVAVKWRAGRPI